MNVIDAFEASQCKTDIPEFRVGDTVRVHQRIVEGNRERIQVFEGVVIARKGGSSTETFTVRRVSFGIGVERIFPLHSPRIEKIEVKAHGVVRRAKLYYLRDRIGKAARVKSRHLRKGEGRKKKKKTAIEEPVAEGPGTAEAAAEAEEATGAAEAQTDTTDE